MLQVWAAITNLFILCWGAYLNFRPPEDTERKRYGIALILCILVLVGFLSTIIISDYVSQQYEIKIRQRISNFIEEGNQLKESCRTEIERTDLKPLYDNWVKRVIEYLSPLDPSYIPRLNMIVIGRGSIGPKINEDIWNFVNAKNQVLIKIIEERKMAKLGGI